MQIKLYRDGEDTADQPVMEMVPPDDTVPEIKIDDQSHSDTPADDGSMMQIVPSAAEAQPSVLAGSYHLQVQSLSDQMSAIESVERLKQMGHQAHIDETDVDGKIYYRVRIGSFPDRIAAQMARDTLTGQGFTDTLIIKNGQ
jgi:cell division septation protein DedD